MTLDDLFKDVYSRLNQQGLGSEIYALDIISVLNEAIESIRTEYVKNGLSSYFAIDEVVSSFSQDPTYSSLHYGTLSKELIPDVPVTHSILNSTVRITDGELLDQVQSWSEGDLAILNDKLYRAVKDISGVNTFGKIFKPQVLRTYAPDSGVAYKAGEYLIDKDGNYYVVTSDFVAQNGVENIDEVFWEFVGDADRIANHYSKQTLNQITLHDGLKQAFSVVGDKVYTNKNISSVSITYVPKWTYTDDVTTEVPMTDQMKGEVIRVSVNKLLHKLARQPIENEPTD